MGRNPSPTPQDPNQPVTMVSWNDAQEFCRKLTQGSRESNGLRPGREFALPSEGQWKTFVGDALQNPELAVIKQDGPERVGSRRANQFGLHDVRGNVAEWTLEKQLIGGSFQAPVLDTLAKEDPGDPETREKDIGFRVILVEPGSAAGR